MTEVRITGWAVAMFLSMIGSADWGYHTGQGFYWFLAGGFFVFAVIELNRD